MQANIHSKLDLLNDLKWSIKQPDIQEIMENSSVYTQFLLSQITKLEVEVLCRAATINDYKKVKHSIRLFKKK